jgi:DNA-binding CsgD family transcriptional regulator
VGWGGERAGADHGVGALSPREREVAGLVADGRTNREIATRLFLRERTIETVLARVFRKAWRALARGGRGTRGVGGGSCLRQFGL